MQYKNNGIYGINKWIPSRPEFVLVVDYGSYKVNNIVVIKMMEQMALNYFRGLDEEEKKALIKKIFDSLSDKEKLEIAKLLTKEMD